MKNDQTLGIIFFIRKEKSLDDVKAPIYLRITINGKRAELSIKRDVEIKNWNKSGRVMGNSETTRQLNEYLTLWERKAYQAHKQIIDEGTYLSSEAIKDILLGRTAKQKTLLEVFEYHNKMLKEKVGIDHAKATYTRYETTLGHIKDFILKYYKRSDIPLAQLNYKFVTDLEHYFITSRNCNQNTTYKYIKNLKRVIHIALMNEWLSKDPFMNFTIKIKPVDRDFLTPEELKAIEDKKFLMPRLDQVRDIFVFCCYTGLAYIDVAELKPDNIRKGIDGELWLNTYRHKTETASNIPLLPKAMEILEKYKNHPVVVNKGGLLPVLSNQKLNSYLKEIADFTGITKNLAFHVARHTFATTVTLTNGVPIESVSSMLGHTSIKTTQIYAKVIQKKVSEDMKALKQKLTNNQKTRKISNHK